VATRQASAKSTTVAKAKTAPVRRRRRRVWIWYAAAALIGPCLIITGVIWYYYRSLSGIIEERLHGEQTRTFPRIFARPFELHRGQGLTDRQLIQRLNDLGYTQVVHVERPGEFAIGQNAIALMVRAGAPDAKLDGKIVRIVFDVPAPPKKKPRNAASPMPATAPPTIAALERTDGEPLTSLTLEQPMLTALISDVREKRRKVPLDQIPTRVRQAVLAIEDRRFYEHPGVDLIRSTGAVINDLRGNKKYMEGGSTLTQQLVKNLLLTPERTIRRKLLEQFMSVIVERKLTKDQILEMYLNEVYLGQRGSFAVHGVAEAARLYFAKDVSNLSLSEAATLAGMIQAPPSLSPFRFPDKCRERRNVTLNAMADAGYISKDAAMRAVAEPLLPARQGLEAEAPYFVDYVEQLLESKSIDLRRNVADVHTSLDVHLQRAAQDAVDAGLAKIDAVLAKRRHKVGPAQAALIAVDPRTGEILALVGGRSYNQSQYNRAVVSHRQPGSVFKPFVYLAAFEQAKTEGRTDLTPATVVIDEPTTFVFEDKDYEPSNYENEYDGPITLRHALAKSRNVATIKVAEMIGYDHVAELWKQMGTSTPPRPYPSIALGVFEATPLEIATAYTIFPNLGEIKPLRAITRLAVNGHDIPPPVAGVSKRVASRETTFLVMNMMRSVLNEGTGAGARAAGFMLDAAGKSGTTNDLRDAWFAGFTPELLTVVWVGLDDNRPIGLSGSQAALPIWTSFMMRALQGHASLSFTAPDDLVFAEIDPDTGYLAGPGCPRTINESFLPGTAPAEICPVHGF
jgi:penicillin-binding protein 1B